MSHFDMLICSDQSVGRCPVPDSYHREGRMHYNNTSDHHLHKVYETFYYFPLSNHYIDSHVYKCMSLSKLCYFLVHTASTFLGQYIYPFSLKRCTSVIYHIIGSITIIEYSNPIYRRTYHHFIIHFLNI